MGNEMHKCAQMKPTCFIGFIIDWIIVNAAHIGLIIFRAIGLFIVNLQNKCTKTQNMSFAKNTKVTLYSKAVPFSIVYELYILREMSTVFFFFFSFFHRN